MNIIFHCQNVEVPQALRDYTQKRLNRLTHYFDKDISTEVHFSSQRAFKTAQLTLRASGQIIRGAEERTPDLRTSIDQASDKLEKQIRHYKEIEVQRARRPHRHGLHADTTPAVAAVAEPPEPPAPIIARRKKFELEYMLPEDAVERMQLLGHTFYVFRSDETEQVSVVYERGEGGFGLLEPG